nr:MAG TPA: protein of unknown function (UPF0154) [Caudoviricetes sp.]
MPLSYLFFCFLADYVIIYIICRLLYISYNFKKNPSRNEQSYSTRIGIF